MIRSKAIGRPIAAVIYREQEFRGEFAHGHLVILDLAGVVWAFTEYQGRDGGRVYSSGKRKQELTALKKDYGRNWIGMGLTWQTMFLRHVDHQHYELVNEVGLQDIRKALGA